MAGLPVEAKVAAVLRATWPDFPMPETAMRPVHPASNSDGPVEIRIERSRQGPQPGGFDPLGRIARHQDQNAGGCNGAHEPMVWPDGHSPVNARNRFWTTLTSKNHARSCHMCGTVALPDVGRVGCRQTQRLRD